MILLCCTGVPCGCTIQSAITYASGWHSYRTAFNSRTGVGLSIRRGKPSTHPTRNTATLWSPPSRHSLLSSTQRACHSRRALPNKLMSCCYYKYTPTAALLLLLLAVHCCCASNCQQIEKEHHTKPSPLGRHSTPYRRPQCSTPPGTAHGHR